MRCLCLDLGCIQEVLCMSQSWKKVFVMARPNSEKRKSSRRSRLFMMSNASMPYVVISAYPGIEIAQQYDFFILRNSSEGWKQRAINAILHIIRWVQRRRIYTHKGSNAVFRKWEHQCQESLIYCNGGFLAALQKRSPNCKSNSMNATDNCG